MTIPEQLQISVLAAPVAAVDRRALSQAWYSALYGRQKAPNRIMKMGCTVRSFRPNGAARLRSHATVKRIDAQPRATAAVKQRETGRTPMSGVHERRDVRAKLVRPIDTGFAPQKQTASATFAFGKRGRVHVVVQQRGSRVQLIALCGRGMAATVSHALEQARYALASRGVRLESRTL